MVKGRIWVFVVFVMTATLGASSGTFRSVNPRSFEEFGVLESSARLLALLGLLQSRTRLDRPRARRAARRHRPDGPQGRRPAARCSTTPSTRYAAGTGTTGSASAPLPPLLLDDEEAVAVTVGLAAPRPGSPGSRRPALARWPSSRRSCRTGCGARSTRAARGGPQAGPENTGSNVEDPEVDAALLTAIAAAIRDQEEVRFDYRDDDTAGRSSRTGWSPGSGAGTSSPATRIPTRGRPTAWTGCG